MRRRRVDWSFVWRVCLLVLCSCLCCRRIESDAIADRKEMRGDI
jgi:hypothetical protein